MSKWLCETCFKRMYPNGGEEFTAGRLSARPCDEFGRIVGLDEEMHQPRWHSNVEVDDADLRAVDGGTLVDGGGQRRKPEPMA